MVFHSSCVSEVQICIRVILVFNKRFVDSGAQPPSGKVTPLFTQAHDKGTDEPAKLCGPSARFLAMLATGNLGVLAARRETCAVSGLSACHTTAV